MWSSGFFNSVSGDRAYTAEQMSGLFEGLITDGVYEKVGNKLAVQPNSGMTIQIATGRGFFGKRWVNNDTPKTITLENADVTLNRYAAIVVKVDTTNAVRSAEPYAKYSSFASSPVKPTMTRTDTVKEYCLAYVYIPAGATAITAANIEDTRSNQDLCGWVTGLIDQLDSNTLYTQFTAIFNEWFNGLVDIIDENVETTLVAAMSKGETVTLPANGWSGNAQTVTVTGMTATKQVVVQPNEDTALSYEENGVRCIEQGANYLTFECESVPAGSVKADVFFSGV